MSNVRPIRNDADYDAALARVDYLMSNPVSGDLRDELDVQTTLIEVYEDEHYPIDLPSPIEAIQFRMEQANLSQADLVPYIGSRAKVSEVLSGKRTLTLKMIRALNAHLGIPAEVLIGDTNVVDLQESTKEVRWDRFPIKELLKRGWLETTTRAAKSAEELMAGLLQQAGGMRAVPQALYRKNDSTRQNASMDPYALQAWCLYVLAKARERKLPATYHEGAIDQDFLRFLATLSRLPDGPKRAVEALAQKGVAVVYARHLPKTYLDGAAMRTKEQVPVIGLSLRFDRLDNFWFCLLHEAVHVWRHLKDEHDFFIDDLKLDPTDHSEDWSVEEEADLLAQEALIPTNKWSDADLLSKATPFRVMAFAQSVNVHPAIVAGRVRRETGNYRLLSQFVGSNEVRQHFEEAS
ncbi:transcriptional regulator [Parasphingopyxis lamellibrachiae]|uniref:HTH-type transcriptional regulator/antitoxin HigA n=1 Tax=Parasphingopyxis lamellibrachiae TaxID=680125 RepID=A0A3D9F834_9SPHN|nr:transcriptional regulator [Parasphingopyxis lamellibrachiae]RED11760.1 HTH-type transcriptional regulator/antitoxin HigA [Parasphingopyxis lamellibrachiae]